MDRCAQKHQESYSHVLASHETRDSTDSTIDDAATSSVVSTSESVITATSFKLRVKNCDVSISRSFFSSAHTATQLLPARAHTHTHTRARTHAHAQLSSASTHTLGIYLHLPWTKNTHFCSQINNSLRLCKSSSTYVLLARWTSS